MDDTRRAELEAIVGNAPIVEETLAVASKEHTEAAAHCKTLADNCRKLKVELEGIEAAKAELKKLKNTPAKPPAKAPAKPKEQAKAKAKS